jgi:serine phosphatase RsbU (regulator of sigma subunit)
MSSVGGDFYNFHSIDPNRIGFFISDVSGHGIPAALITFMVKIVVDMLGNEAGNPENFVHQLNTILAPYLNKDFITAGYAMIDLGNKEIEYIRAGHAPLFVFDRGTSTVQRLSPRGRLMGMGQEFFARSATVSLQKGDRVLLLTDGITECARYDNLDGSPRQVLYEESRLEEFIIESAGYSTNEFADALIDDLKSWSNESSFEDDVTFIVIDVG